MVHPEAQTVSGKQTLAASMFHFHGEIMTHPAGYITMSLEVDMICDST